MWVRVPPAPQLRSDKRRRNPPEPVEYLADSKRTCGHRDRAVPQDALQVATSTTGAARPEHDGLGGVHRLRASARDLPGHLAGQVGLQVSAAIVVRDIDQQFRFLADEFGADDDVAHGRVGHVQLGVRLLDQIR